MNLLKIYGVISLFATASLPANILITGVLDGDMSGGLPKAIELYVTADIPDLSVYGVGSANNGGGTDDVEFTLSGSASQGDFIYIASEDVQFQAVLGFAPTFINGAANINGDDAIELFLNNTVIDLFGDINVDGTGQAWEYADSYAYRKNGTSANTAFNLSDWNIPGAGSLDGLDASQQGAAIPFGTYTAVAVPEPATIASLLGLAGLAFVTIRRRRC